MHALVRAVATLVCVLLLGTLGPAAIATQGKPGKPPVPVERSMSLLCTGYAGCRDAGMSNGGYKAASDTMYWRMYSGHNCTNYVAYRMTRNGMPNERPWSGEGNASYWGSANREITDSVPAVGAVAWWGANVRPAGSAGHVAYVEQVLSPDEIIVSQDSWGGDFSWARITRAGGSWPSGFIHFNDLPLDNTVKPTVSGIPKVGGLLTASAGSWTPTGSATTYAYQWRAAGVAIAKATNPSLKLKLGQQGKRISVLVTATRPGYPTATATSAKTSTVEPGVIANTAQPTTTGEAKVDSILTASPGAWTPAPTALAYQWLADDVPIADATTATFVPGPAQVGKAISVTVTASKAGYDDVTSTSTSTAPVAPGTFTVTRTATVTGTPRLGHTLTFDPGISSPAQEPTVTWLRDGVLVAGAVGSTYQLTAADLGARIAARMTLTRPGYTTLTVKTPGSTRVKTVPTLKVRTTRPGDGRLAFTLTVTAEGLVFVPGTVQILSHGKILKELTLRRGAASTTLKGLPTGTRTFKVRYLASDTVTAAVVKRTVRIG